MDRKTLAQFLDLANHHSESTQNDVCHLCQKVDQFGFHAAFVNPCWVSLAKESLKSEAKVGTVVAFPLGQETQDVKILTSIKAIDQGADELDISMNVGWFKSGQTDKVLGEMKAMVEAVRNLKKKTIVKFIIETGLLTDEEIKKASEMVLSSGADFIKTNSGMGPRGASLKDVELIKNVVGDKIKIKVAGGIDTLKKAIDFIQAGVSRIGTSKAVEIIKELDDFNKSK